MVQFVKGSLSQSVFTHWASSLFSQTVLSVFSTAIAKSGHTISQMPQPLHFSVFVTCGSVYPLALMEEEIFKIFLGQLSTQMRHPLQ
jgi:hypothetical protein